MSAKDQIADGFLFSAGEEVERQGVNSSSFLLRENSSKKNRTRREWEKWRERANLWQVEMVDVEEQSMDWKDNWSEKEMVDVWCSVEIVVHRQWHRWSSILLLHLRQHLHLLRRLRWFDFSVTRSSCFLSSIVVAHWRTKSRLVSRSSSSWSLNRLSRIWSDKDSFDVRRAKLWVWRSSLWWRSFDVRPNPCWEEYLNPKSCSSLETERERERRYRRWTIWRITNKSDSCRGIVNIRIRINMVMRMMRRDGWTPMRTG